MTFQDPFPEPGFVLIQRQVPVFCHSFFGNASADGRARIDQFVGRECGSAFLTLVPVRIAVRAAGACSHNIPVGQESTGFGVIELFGLFFKEFSAVVEFFKKSRGGFVVDPGTGSGINIKRYAQPLE